MRVLATGGHAAAPGRRGTFIVVALASTLSCSFRRDVAPSSTLLDVALEADELAAVAAELEAAKSGAADGAWALATWAPAGFADAVGGFNFVDFDLAAGQRPADFCGSSPLRSLETKPSLRAPGAVTQRRQHSSFIVYTKLV